MTSAGTRSALALVAVLALVGGFVAGRLTSEAPAAAPPTWLERLTADLDLRPDQVTAIDQLLASEDAALAALVARSREELRAPVAERRQQTEDAMLALLDPDQRRLYEELTRP